MSCYCLFLFTFLILFINSSSVLLPKSSLPFHPSHLCCLPMFPPITVSHLYSVFHHCLCHIFVLVEGPVQPHPGPPCQPPRLSARCQHTTMAERVSCAGEITVNFIEKNLMNYIHINIHISFSSFFSAFSCCSWFSLSHGCLLCVTSSLSNLQLYQNLHCCLVLVFLKCS